MTWKNDYIEPKLEISNLDNYYIRHSIFCALKANLNSFSGKMIDVGCGRMPYKEYILENSKIDSYSGLDLKKASYDERRKPDIFWNGRKIPIEANTYECALATEVLEHCPDAELVLNEIYRILKPGGILFLTVPFLWNLHEVPNDEYRYTPFSLRRHLSNAGFKDVDLKASGGWHASLAQMLGLWVKRSNISPAKRKILSVIVKPVVKKLIKLDKTGDVNFQDGQMITGLYGMAKK